MTPDTMPAGGAQMAILSSRLRKITRKMTNTLFRSSRSAVINTARDFSCCLVTRDHELLEAAESIAVHVMGGPDLSSRLMTARHPDLRPGDAFLHNSPYHGNSHPGDHQVMVPIFDADGRHRMTAVVKAHMADIGNSIPTTVHPAARDVYEEGALIFPAVRIQRDYRDVDDIIEMCRLRFRIPQAWYGDYMAMIGGARTAEREIMELAAEVGWDTLDEHVRQWFDYSERLMADAISRLPAGQATASTFHDALPDVTGPIAVTAKVDSRPAEGRITVDFRDNPDCVPCGLNLTEATALACGRIGVYSSLTESVPLNAGSFRRIEVLLRENCCIGIPRHPASCSVATTGLATRAAGMTQLAISGLGEGVGKAEDGPTAGGFAVFGTDPRNAREYVEFLLTAASGGGGAPYGDGLLMDFSAGGGTAFRTTTEMSELRLPICIWEDRLVIDEVGHGRQRGMPAHLVQWGPVDAPVFLSWFADGEQYPALGARGGEDGRPNAHIHIKADGSEDEPGPSGFRMIQPGERFSILTAGGAGYGPPAERPHELVAEDVAEGIISARTALEVYGYEAGRG